MHTSLCPLRRLLGVVGAAAALTLPSTLALADSTEPDPDPVPLAPTTVSAQVLPTVQIDGIAWAQVVIGSTVYVGGEFTTARPAGADAGTATVKRANLLAYDLDSGKLVESFDVPTDGQVLALAATPDGKRLYLGGTFTHVGGEDHYRAAAIDVATGKVVTAFSLTFDTQVRAIVATDDVVYFAGQFSTANGQKRTRLAASDHTGALYDWAPSADQSINTMVLTPDRERIIIGGGFAKVNGASWVGMASLNRFTGETQQWDLVKIIKNGMAKRDRSAAITHLSADDKWIYGTGYTWRRGGNFEGVFAADPRTGKLQWLNDCHGDSYGAFSTGDVVYQVGHPHGCSTLGGFPTVKPEVYHRALAMVNANVRPIGPVDDDYYENFQGKPGTRLLNWFPDHDIGTASGQSQGPWHVTGAKGYILTAGEFLHVNGVPQQGLARFRAKGPGTSGEGPQVSGADWYLAVSADNTTGARIQWPTNWDRDDARLTYEVHRDGNTTLPVLTKQAVSTFWSRPELTFRDGGLTPGTHSYRVQACDDSGNCVRSATVTIDIKGA